MKFTDENFKSEVLESTAPVLVDFYADWCGPCKMMAPIIDELAEEFKDKVKVGKMDVDASPQIPTQYAVMSIPTLILFKNGEVVEKFVGTVSKEKLSTLLNESKEK